MALKCCKPYYYLKRGKCVKGIGKLERGTLDPYRASQTQAVRRKHLKTAIRRLQRLKKIPKHDAAVIAAKKLYAVSTMTKNRAPVTSKKIRSDAEWIKQNLY